MSLEIKTTCAFEHRIYDISLTWETGELVRRLGRRKTEGGRTEREKDVYGPLRRKILFNNHPSGVEYMK
jgi:hypothetical protein